VLNDSDRPVAVVREMFPTTGPYAPERVIAAAEAISELWRYLGHALAGRGEGIAALDQVSDAYDLVGNLAEADSRASDVLQRLKSWTNYVDARSMDNYGQVSTGRYAVTRDAFDGTPDNVSSIVKLAGRFLHESAVHHSNSASALRSAHSQLSYVYTVELDEDDENDAGDY
jgi:hypothetical protein